MSWSEPWKRRWFEELLQQVTKLQKGKQGSKQQGARAPEEGGRQPEREPPMWVAMTPEATPPATRRTTPGGTAVPPMKSLAHLPSKAVAGTLDGPYWSTPVNRDGGPSANLGPQLPQQAATPLQDVREGST